MCRIWWTLLITFLLSSSTIFLFWCKREALNAAVLEAPPPSLLFSFSFGGKLIYSKCQTKRKSRCASARICIGKEREKKNYSVSSSFISGAFVSCEKMVECVVHPSWKNSSPPPPFCFVFFFSFFHRLFIWSSCISDVFSFSTSYEKDKKKKISWCWQLASVISLPLSLFKFHF